MLTLIQNELIKIFRRPSTFVMIGIIILMVVGAGLLTNSNVNKTIYKENWKSQLQNENKDIANKLAKLPDDSTVAQNYKENLALNTYRIDNDIKPNSSINTWTFVKETKPILSFVGLFTIVIAASIVSLEFNWGTIKLIVIRPYSRFKLLLAKYITVLLISLILISTLFILSFLMGLSLFGLQGDNIQLTYLNGKVIQENMVLYLIKYFLLSSVNLWVVSTMAFAISTVFRNNSLALGISLFSYFTGGIVTGLIAQKFGWAKYILFANTDLNMYSSGSVLVKGMTPAFSITVLSIYLIIFLAVSFVSFTKRDIAA
ncbi:ABC transporter permease (plasmid) [Priestia megaterium]|uniref:ABC transporter permease n=1 Tax=Priestia megaterium TaxID=1404 RepID=UPI00351E5D67